MGNQEPRPKVVRDPRHIVRRVIPVSTSGILSKVDDCRVYLELAGDLEVILSVIVAVPVVEDTECAVANDIGVRPSGVLVPSRSRRNPDPIDARLLPTLTVQGPS